MLPLHLGDDYRLSLSSSQNSPILVAPPILPTWLLTNQCFIKSKQVTNLYRVQDHCPTVLRRFPHSLVAKPDLPSSYFSTSHIHAICLQVLFDIYCKKYYSQWLPTHWSVASYTVYADVEDASNPLFRLLCSGCRFRFPFSIPAEDSDL